MQPNPHTVKDELLKAYPKKTARKREPNRSSSTSPGRRRGSRDQGQRPHYAGRHNAAGCTYALQGRGDRADTRTS